MIPDDKKSVSSFSLIENKMKENLRVIISEEIQANEIEPFKNAKTLYKACMNTDVINSLGTAPFTTVFNQMGGWPTVVGDAWNETAWTRQGAAVLSRNFGYSVSYFLSFAVSTDDKDSTKQIILVSLSCKQVT